MERKKNSELTDEFMIEFTKVKIEILQDIEKLVGSQNVEESLNLISQKIQNLTIKLHEAIRYLPAYTAKVRQNDLRALELQLKDKEAQVKPKSKFGFKKKIATPVSTISTSQKPVKDLGTIEEKIPEIPDHTDDLNFLTIDNKDDKVIIYQEDQLNRHDIMVRNMDDKEISLIGSPSTLRIYNLQNCKLLSGPVQTSIFIENCSNCSFFLCCQQLRTHNSKELDVYLRVSSRAIIEESTNIRFAPYIWNHPKSSELHKVANIDEHLERFNAVDDFHWLAFSTPSPNWSILPENERATFP